MTNRERLLAVLQGREHDRVPFAQYDGCAAPNEEIWSLVGREKVGILRWSNIHRFEAPHCRFETERFERNGREGLRTTLYTPEGTLTEERVFEPVYGSSSCHKHYVKEPEDYRILAAYLRDLVVVEDIEHFLRDERELGEDGLPHVWMERTPYQQLWVQWVSLADLCVHLAECPEAVEECVALLTRSQRQVFEIARRVPLPYAVIPDNLTAPAIGEKYFRRYCLPLYNELADMLADRDIPVFVHMDGDLKPLWKAIGETKVRGIDSLSPPPDNDTSAGQAAALWPEMRLFVNFPSSVHLRPPDQVYAAAMEILTEAGHTGRLEIQLSENVPPDRWRVSVPAIVRAVDDFGKP
jgi:hypothetical protein